MYHVKNGDIHTELIKGISLKMGNVLFNGDLPVRVS